METQDTNNAIPENATTQGGGLGPVIGILIVVALIAFGGLYFWGTKMNNTDNGQSLGDNGQIIDLTVEEPGTITEAEFNALLDKQSTSANSNQTDPTLDKALDNLNDLNSLDAELSSLGSQL